MALPTDGPLPEFKDPKEPTHYEKATETLLVAIAKAAATGQSNSALQYAQAYQALKDANKIR